MKEVIKASDTFKEPIVVVVDKDGNETPFRGPFETYEKAKDFCEACDWVCDESLDRYLRGRLEIREDSDFHVYG